jgi:Flp pilus assembly protein TadD
MRLNLQSFALATSAVALSGCGLFPAARPPGAQFTLHVADAAMAAGAPDMALRVAEIVLRRDPHDVSAMVAKGQALYAMGADDRALAAYRQAVAADPSNPKAQIGLGRALIRSDPGAAEAAFLVALAQQPDNRVALNDLGIARDMLGQHAEAQTSYRQALALAPESVDVQTNLGLSLALSGDRTSAVRLLQPLAAGPGATPTQRANLAIALAGPNVPAAADDPAPAPGPIASTMMPLAISPAPVDFVRREALPAKPPLAVAQQAPEVGPTPAVAMTAAPASAPVRRAVSAVTPAQLIPGLAKQGMTMSAITPPDPVIGEPARSTAPVILAKSAVAAPNTWASSHYVRTAALDPAQGSLGRWGKLRARWPDPSADPNPMVQHANIIQQTFWRMATGAFVNADSASEFYAMLRAGGSGCWPVAPTPE